MCTFHLFPNLPKELRLEIYEDTFKERMLQLGVDAGVPFPPKFKHLGKARGPKKPLHTRLPELFSVCKESRYFCQSVFVAFGPTFIHPKLDTLYISLYAIGRMIATDSGWKDDGTSAYSLAAFDKVAIECGIKDLPEDLPAWMRLPKALQVRQGVKQLCIPGKWPATDYGEFFRCFGVPKQVLVVRNSVMKWHAGFSRFTCWRTIELSATKLESGDQKNLAEFLKVQLPSPSSGSQMNMTVVDALNSNGVSLACPYSWRTWLDKMEGRYIWIG